MEKKDAFLDAKLTIELTLRELGIENKLKVSRIDESHCKKCLKAKRKADGTIAIMSKPGWIVPVCAICTEKMPLESPAALMPCTHYFHPVCLASWLKIN